MSNQRAPSPPHKEAFYRNDAGEEIACDSVRFAVGEPETGIRSGIWSAFCSQARKSTDMFMATEGLSNDVKISFHSRDAIVAYRSEKMASLIERQVIAPDAQRQTEAVPILSEPFLVVSIAFFPGVLKRPEKWRSPPGKPITVIETPPMDHFLRVHVVHSFDEPALLQDHISGQHLQWFARLRAGNRHLTFFKLAYPCDWETEKEVLRKHVQNIPARDDLIELAKRQDLAALFWGRDNTYLNFFEIHTLTATPTGIGKSDLG